MKFRWVARARITNAKWRSASEWWAGGGNGGKPKELISTPAKMMGEHAEAICCGFESLAGKLNNKKSQSVQDFVPIVWVWPEECMYFPGEWNVKMVVLPTPTDCQSYRQRPMKMERCTSCTSFSYTNGHRHSRKMEQEKVRMYCVTDRLRVQAAQ